MKIDAIFISHIHGDHAFGLFGLLSTMGMLSRMAPLNIYAPVGFGPILKFFLSYYGDGIPFEKLSRSHDDEVASGGLPFEIAGDLRLPAQPQDRHLRLAFPGKGASDECEEVED